MAPRNEEQLQHLREDRKIQIMKAALKVFAENGIKLTKISMVAKEAGVSHGLLYHYFTSKEEVLHKSLEWATSGSPDLFDQLEGASLGPLEKIKNITKMGLTEGNSDVFRVIQHIFRSDAVPEHTKHLVEEEGQTYVKRMLPIFIQGQAEEEIIPGDPEELLELYLTVLSGIMTEDLSWWNEHIDRRVNLLVRMISIR